MNGLLVIEKMFEAQKISKNFNDLVMKCFEILTSKMHYERVFFFSNYLKDNVFIESSCNDDYAFIIDRKAQDHYYFLHLLKEYKSKIICCRDSVKDERIKLLMLRNKQKSLLLNPIFSQSNLIGYIGVDSCNDASLFSKKDEILMEVLSLIIADAIHKAWQPGQESLASADMNSRVLSITQANDDEEESTIQSIISSIGSLLIALDDRMMITLVNDEAEKYLGSHRSELIGKIITDFIQIDLPEGDIVTVLKNFSESDDLKINFRSKLKMKFQDEIICDIAVSKIRNPEGAKAKGIVIILSDITEYYSNVCQIGNLNKTDYITGAISRQYFESSLMQKIMLSNISSLSIIVCDINGLKLINDLVSHQKGDELLFHVCNIISSMIPDGSNTVRWGGDEFLVYIENMREYETEALIRELKLRIEEIDYDLPISISFGYKVVDRFDYSEIFSAIHDAENHLNRHKLLEGSSNRSFIINSMRKSLYAKSNETEEHAGRLWDICKLLSDEMALGMGLRDEIELLAQLHDIGKISISDNILLKPSSLTADEWKVMKTHSEAGYRILCGIPELSQIAIYVLSHHERWDGCGYPNGLKGEEIPLPSRIIAIADAFDAMTQDRVYHKAESINAAREEILRCSGTQFDPNIVNAFMKVSLNFSEHLFI